MPYIVHAFNGEPIRHYELKAEMTIGRNPDNDIQLADPTVSSEHAVIEVGATGDCTIRDLGSTNGILFRGKRVKKQQLFCGEHIVVGSHELQLVAQVEGPLAATARIVKSWIPGIYYTAS